MRMALLSALPTPYEIYQGGKKVAGDHAPTRAYPLPVGDYQIRYREGDTKVTKDIVITDGERTTIIVPK